MFWQCTGLGGPNFLIPPPRQATFGAVRNLCVPRTSSHFGSFGCGNTGLHCSHRMKESNDPGRTRTYNPQLRGPMPYPLGHRTTWHGPASITWASRATSQWSETDKTRAGWFRHYKWSKEKVILFDGKNILNHPALVLAMYRPWRPKFLKPPRPDRQRLGLSGISVCPELPAISAALAVGTQGFSAVTEWKSQMILVDSNLQSPAPWADALSIGPQDHLAWVCIHHFSFSCNQPVVWDRQNPGGMI